MPARLQALIQKHLSRLGGVEAVFTVKEGPVIHVWTVVTSQASEDAVYDGERKILDELTAPTVDFHLTIGADPRLRKATCVFRRSGDGAATQGRALGQRKTA
jgi:hypothetical protein